MSDDPLLMQKNDTASGISYLIEQTAYALDQLAGVSGDVAEMLAEIVSQISSAVDAISNIDI